METTTYEIRIRLNTPDGEQLAGQFYLGSNNETANELFKQLNGQDVSADRSVIIFEFAEIDHQLPVNLTFIACNLEEASQNVKLILKALFKQSILPE